MKPTLALAAAAWLAWPAWSARPGGLPLPPERMFEAALHYVEGGELAKAGRVLDNMGPLLDELGAAFGLDLAAETRKAMGTGDVSQARAAVLKAVYYHMRLELAHALKARGHQAGVNVRVAYLDYLLLSPRLLRDRKLAREAERLFRSVHELVAAATPEARDLAAGQVREIERVCLPALDTGQAVYEIQH